MERKTVKRRLEDLRLAPFVDNPPISLVPCHETSDARSLCREPLVSVLMTTYNHADNIRQAVAGVMMQKTDFPFELIIGEDASQDGTREICFELQRAHPEQIRVLWSETNVHHLNGNGRRVAQAARGAFWAYCEGDDVWRAPDKLQRQIDLLREHPEVGVCLGGTEVEHVAEGRIEPFPYSGRGVRVVPGAAFIEAYLNGHDLGGFSFDTRAFQTSGYVFRASALRAAAELCSEILGWNWRFRDLIWVTTTAQVSDVGFVLDCLSRYRLTGTNATSMQGPRLLLDGLLYDLLLRMHSQGVPFEMARDFMARRLRRHLGRILAQQTPDEQRQSAKRLTQSEDLRALFLLPGYRRVQMFLENGRLTPSRWKRFSRWGRLCEMFRWNRHFYLGMA